MSAASFPGKTAAAAIALSLTDAEKKLSRILSHRPATLSK